MIEVCCSSQIICSKTLQLKGFVIVAVGSSVLEKVIWRDDDATADDIEKIKIQANKQLEEILYV